jgi:hypothetical protein
VRKDALCEIGGVQILAPLLAASDPEIRFLTVNILTSLAIGTYMLRCCSVHLVAVASFSANTILASDSRRLLIQFASIAHALTLVGI